MYNAVIYAISNAFSPAAAFLILLVITRYLSPYQYGLVAMFMVLYQVLINLVGANVQRAIIRQYFNKQIQINVYVSTCLCIVGLSMIVCGGGIALLQPWIYSLTKIPLFWLWITLGIAGLFSILQIRINLWIAEKKPWPCLCLQFTLSALVAATTIALIVSKQAGWEGRALGQLMANSMCALLAFYFLFRDGFIRLNFRLDYFKQALHYGTSLIPHAISIWALNATDRLIIAHVLGLEETGIYSVGANVAMIIFLFQDAFSRAWIPTFYEGMENDAEKDKKHIIKTTYLFCAGIFIFAIVFGLGMPHLMGILFDPSYEKAKSYILILSIAYACLCIYRIFGLYFLFDYRTLLLTKISLAAAVFNLLISYVLVIKFGAMGAAIGTLFAYALVSIFTISIACKNHKMPWRV